MSSKLEKWNDAYLDAEISKAKPSTVLFENSHLIPEQGNALDLACGRAGNSILLAQNGLMVDAVDISPVVLESLDKFSKVNGLSISSECRDVEKDGLQNKKYDLIVVSYFLNRELFPKIVQCLKPNGLLFYETWSQQKIDDSGPRNPDFRLKSGELLELTSTLKPIFYREEGSSGNLAKGNRNIAMIIAKKD